MKAFKILREVALTASLFAAAVVQAQIMTVPIPPCEERPALPGPLPTPTKPIGIPEPLKITAPNILTCESVIGTNTEGAIAAFACPNGTSKKLYMYAVFWQNVTPDMVKDFAQLALPGDSRQRIVDMATKYQTMNIWDMCQVWGHKREEINAMMVMPPVSVSSWAVLKNSIQATRPAYAVVGGVRSTLSTGRATVGVACDCTSPIVEGTTTHCPYEGSAGLVTACVKQ